MGRGGQNLLYGDIEAEDNQKRVNPGINQGKIPSVDGEIRFDRPDLNYPSNNTFDQPFEAEALLSTTKQQWMDAGMMFTEALTKCDSASLATGKVKVIDDIIHFAVYSMPGETDTHLITTKHPEDYYADLDDVLGSLSNQGIIGFNDLKSSSEQVTNRLLQKALIA
jgi:hypothetical protein